MANRVDEDALSDEQGDLFAVLKKHHEEMPILPWPNYGFMKR